jgi:hypothetical protein
MEGLWRTPVADVVEGLGDISMVRSGPGGRREVYARVGVAWKSDG